MKQVILLPVASLAIAHAALSRGESLRALRLPRALSKQSRKGLKVKKDVKRRATETISQYLRRQYAHLRGEMCRDCQTVEPEIHKRHLALAECESATLRDGVPVRCGRAVCRHHLIYQSELTICARCAGHAPSAELVASYEAKPVQSVQPDLFAIAA